MGFGEHCPKEPLPVVAKEGGRGEACDFPMHHLKKRQLARLHALRRLLQERQAARRTHVPQTSRELRLAHPQEASAEQQGHRTRSPQVLQEHEARTSDQTKANHHIFGPLFAHRRKTLITFPSIPLAPSLQTMRIFHQILPLCADSCFCGVLGACYVFCS